MNEIKEKFFWTDTYLILAEESFKDVCDEVYESFIEIFEGKELNKK